MPTIDMSELHAVTLTEAPASGNDEQYVVEVEYQFISDDYIARVMHTDLQFGWLTGRGVSMCDALHNLADSIESARIYHSERYEPDAALNTPRLRKCQYCKGKFFFVTTMAGKWMPIDGESIAVKDLGGVRGYQLDGLSLAGKGGQVQARPLSWRARGQAWVAHQEVCGRAAQGPASSVLFARWEHNRGVTQAAIDEAVREIQDVLVPRSTS